MISIIKIGIRQIVAALFILLFFNSSESCSDNNRNKTNHENDTVSNNRPLEKLLESDEWVAPDTNTIPGNDSGNLIKYGRILVSHTAEYFGPKGKINHFANGMNCQNCHLEAGTKLYANSYSAVYAVYPKFRPRSGTVEHLEKRINDCMERSMNGKKLDSLSKEMRAMVAYINWVGKDVKKGVSPKGASVVDLPWLDRAADTTKGEIAFKKNCVSCHGDNGQGKLNADSITYMYPPLWGPNSYNTAAGLYRLSRFAGFVKSNMPNLKSSFDKPTLTDEEAWDIAAFVNSRPRPDKKFKKDWPDISKKPVDHPFGPYSDNFSETRHKFGPYKEIIEASKKK
jgi:thiosulfate dehydrogenase